MADDEETVSDAMSLCGDCGDPAVAFMEVYSLPRIAPAVCRVGLKVGPSLDLETSVWSKDRERLCVVCRNSNHSSSC